MARFVKFPGTAGSYASTPDQNRLDADTAHLQQSIQKWAGFAGGSAAAQSTALTPIFGDFHGQWSAAAGGTAGLRSNMGNTVDPGFFDATAGTEYTYIVYVASDQAVGEVDVRIAWFDANDIPITNPFVQVSLTTGFAAVSLTETAPANTSFGVCQIVARNTNVGQVMYWDASCVREGSDATFVPSLRIVGDLDLRANSSVDNPGVINAATLIGRYEAVGVSRSYRTAVDTAEFIFWYGNAGASAVTNTIAHGLSTAELALPHEWRATRIASSGAIAYYLDAVSLGSDTSVAGSVNPGDLPCLVGAFGTGSAGPLQGDVFWAEVRDGIDGPIVAEFNADDIPIP